MTCQAAPLEDTTQHNTSSQPVKIIFKTRQLQQVEAGVTHILPVSARVMQMKNLSLGSKYKEEFPLHSQCDFVNYNQFWPNDAILLYHPQINIAVLDSLEKHHCAALSFCSIFIVVRRRFVAISSSGLCEELILFMISCIIYDIVTLETIFMSQYIH